MDMTGKDALPLWHSVHVGPWSSGILLGTASEICRDEEALRHRDARVQIKSLSLWVIHSSVHRVAETNPQAISSHMGL